MALQNSGTISMSEIGTEFSDPNPLDLSDLRDAASLSGEVSLSDFYGLASSLGLFTVNVAGARHITSSENFTFHFSDSNDLLVAKDLTTGQEITVNDNAAPAFFTRVGNRKSDPNTFYVLTNQDQPADRLIEKTYTFTNGSFSVTSTRVITAPIGDNITSWFMNVHTGDWVYFGNGGTHFTIIKPGDTQESTPLSGQNTQNVIRFPYIFNPNVNEGYNISATTNSSVNDKLVRYNPSAARDSVFSIVGNLPLSVKGVSPLYYNGTLPVYGRVASTDETGIALELYNGNNALLAGNSTTVLLPDPGSTSTFNMSFVSPSQCKTGRYVPNKVYAVRREASFNSSGDGSIYEFTIDSSFNVTLSNSFDGLTGTFNGAADAASFASIDAIAFNDFSVSGNYFVLAN